MRVAVTGANGYLGPHVVRALQTAGHQVVALGRTAPDTYSVSDVPFVAFDVLDESADLAALPGGVPEAIVHLAWQDGFVHDSYAHVAQVSSHFRFLTGAHEAGVRRVVVLGTMHEIGYWEGAITAETPTNPQSMYGIAKDALRRSLTRAFTGTDVLRWVRSYYITGDDRRNHSIFTKLLAAEARGDELFPFTSGKNEYDFIDVAELGQQIAVVTEAEWSGVVNCCSGVPESLASRVERFIIDNKLNIRLDYGAFPDRPYDSPAVWGDATQIQSLVAAQGGSA